MRDAVARRSRSHLVYRSNVVSCPVRDALNCLCLCEPTLWLATLRRDLLPPTDVLWIHEPPGRLCSRPDLCRLCCLCGATMGLALCRMEYTNWYTAWWCIPPAVRHVAPPPGRRRRATDPISMYTGARLYRVTAYTSHLYTQLRTKAPLFVGRQYALSMTVHHACLHEHRVSTLRATLCMHPAELHSVFVSFLSPCFGCRRRCPAQ